MKPPLSVILSLKLLNWLWIPDLSVVSQRVDLGGFQAVLLCCKTIFFLSLGWWYATQLAMMAVDIPRRWVDFLLDRIDMKAITLAFIVSRLACAAPHAGQNVRMKSRWRIVAMMDACRAVRAHPIRCNNGHTGRLTASRTRRPMGQYAQGNLQPSDLPALCPAKQ